MEVSPDVITKIVIAGTPEAHLLSFIPDPPALPNLVIQIDYKVFGELSFHLGSFFPINHYGVCDLPHLLSKRMVLNKLRPTKPVPRQ
jgi:hypothetical protein